MFNLLNWLKRTKKKEEPKSSSYNYTPAEDALIVTMHSQGQSCEDIQRALFDRLSKTRTVASIQYRITRVLKIREKVRLDEAQQKRYMEAKAYLKLLELEAKKVRRESKNV